ncbi:hypothetical protein BURK1_03417 [Burkholderiales bacterium]|nr:hypothetical protein BURK1_03417 [Burkholderiales bacterium]
MSSKEPSGSLLETLRAQSDAVRGQGDAARRPVEEALRETDRRLWRAFKWLDEAVAHLEVIKPAVAHEFRVGDLLTITSPKFENGFLSFRRKSFGGQEVIEQIELFYRLTGDKPVIVKVPPAAVSSVESKLGACQIRYQYRTEMDEVRATRQGVFTVEQAVVAMIRFVPDYRRHTVEVTMRNVDRFESVTLEFPADALEEPALEDLVRLIMGQANTFLRRAPLAGIGAARRAPEMGPEVYRIEKTVRPR